MSVRSKVDRGFGRIIGLAVAVGAAACSPGGATHTPDHGVAPDGGALDAAVDLASNPVANDASATQDLSQPQSDLSANGPWTRDWTANPAVYQQTGASRLWGVSDVHGDRTRLIALLSAAGLVGGTATAPTWAGGTDTLVVNGDNIDKGSQSIEVLDYWMALIPQATSAGGHLVVLMGNHEVEFLNNPTNSKAAALDAELTTETPQMFADVSDPHGLFLHERPIAAIVDGWFFSHAGNSQGMSASSIASKYMTLVDAGTWGDPFFLDPSSIIEARNWWPSSNTTTFLDGYLTALPAKHIVFGHSPPTFASPPTGNIEVHFAGRLLLIDVGMSSAVNDSTGKLLRVDHPGQANEQVTMVDPSGTSTPLDLTAP